MPPSKRLPKWVTWGFVVMTAKQWWHNAVFTTWANGSTSPAYNPTGTYHSGDRVIYCVQSYSFGYVGLNAYYGDNAVYEALCINPDGSINPAGFTGIPPTVTNIAPSVMPATITNTTQALLWLYNYNVANPGCLWIQVSPDFIGANERVLYNARNLTFEWALNKWFGTTFRQPGPLWNTYGNDPINNPLETPDIYIIGTQESTDWYLAPDELASELYPDTSVLSDYLTPDNGTGVNPYDFTIYIPLNVYNALNPTPALRDGIVRAFADKINASGMKYNIVTY